MTSEPAMLDARVGDLVDDVATRTPAPGAGAVTGLVATLSAALAEMVARFSDDDEAAAECVRLRRLVEPLADADGVAYGRYLAAVRLPRDDDSRRERLTATLSEATDVPLRMAEVAAAVAEHAARLAREGNPRLRGDAVAAALVAAAAARSAAALVAINLAGKERFASDPRPGEASALARAAQAAADSAAAAT